MVIQDNIVQDIIQDSKIYTEIYTLQNIMDNVWLKQVYETIIIIFFKSQAILWYVEKLNDLKKILLFIILIHIALCLTLTSRGSTLDVIIWRL